MFRQPACGGAHLSFRFHAQRRFSRATWPVLPFCRGRRRRGFSFYESGDVSALVFFYRPLGFDRFDRSDGVSVARELLQAREVVKGFRVDVRSGDFVGVFHVVCRC